MASEVAEERRLPFVTTPNSKVIARVNREMRQRMYLMGKRIIGDERDPVGVEFYVMGDIGKTFTVKIRQFPSCQCGDFLLTRLCKHMVFVSWRVLQFKQNDPLIWQRALLPSEIKRVIACPAVTPVKPKSKFRRLKESFMMGYGPNDILEHPPVYCPVCWEEVNFFEEAVYEREESLLEQLYKQNEEKKKVTQLKVKLDMGTPKSMIEKQKKEAAKSSTESPAQAEKAPPAETPAAAPAPTSSTSEDAAPGGSATAESSTPGEAPAGGAESAESSTAPTTDAASPPAEGGAPAEGEQTPAPAAGTAQEGAGGEGGGGEEAAKAPEGPPGPPPRPKPYEPLLFCPQKSCEFEGCVKVVHQYCWLKWRRFRRVD